MASLLEGSQHNLLATPDDVRDLAPVFTCSHEFNYDRMLREIVRLDDLDKTPTHLMLSGRGMSELVTTIPDNTLEPAYKLEHIENGYLGKTVAGLLIVTDSYMDPITRWFSHRWALYKVA